MNVDNILDISKKVWGKIPEPAQLIKREKIRKFIMLARKVAKPEIDSSGAERKGFALLGQRFVPDSYIMQNLVSKRGSLKYTGDKDKKPFTYGTVVPYGPVRTFPRGLDIFVVLGSRKAAQILKKEGDTSYEGYDKRILSLKKQIVPMIQQSDDKPIYNNLFSALKSLLKLPNSKYVPIVFSSSQWDCKQLNTSLASWTEFRHDNVLYIKQSYTAVGTAAVVSTPPEGYVEPYPEFYLQIKNLISKLYMKIINRSPLSKSFRDNFRDFDKVMNKLIAISNKELDGVELNSGEWQDISEMAACLKASTTFPYSIRKKIMDDSEIEMPLVTDVHTDNNSGKVLQEAVGYPYLIKLKIKKGDKTSTFTGGIYSYYEFKQPIENRLTDQEWQRIVSENRYIPLVLKWFSYPSCKVLFKN